MPKLSNTSKISIIAVVLIVLLAFGARPSRAAGSYVVQPGDTLFNIAARFNVSISELATINHIYDVHSIYVGQLLLLPNPLPASVYPTYPVYTPPVYTPPYPTVPTYPGGTTVTTVTTYISYTVRPGDFLASIAARFNTTPDAILSANAIANPNLLYVGQVLTIPRTTTTVRPPLRPRPVYGNIYIVQPGDTLYLIGARFRRDIYTIARVNGLLNLNAIYAGMALIIP